MKAALALAAALVGIARAGTVQGFDISGWQPTVNFAAAYKSGARFVMIKVRDEKHSASPE